jgi:hypothetical protein
MNDDILYLTITSAVPAASPGAEFAMFTRGPERLVMRGNERTVNISPPDAAKLSARGYKWSGHTHPGYSLVASEGDYDVLAEFDQKRSVIYNINGEYQRITNIKRKNKNKRGHYAQTEA